MSSYCVRLCTATVFALLLFFGVHLDGAAQNNNSVELQENDSETEKVVRIVRFSGNDEIGNRTLRRLIRTENNREFLNIPRFTPWYYLWQAVGVGESPSYLNRDMLSNDRDRVQTYYENMGYFDAVVDTSVIEYRENRVEVSFIIEEGPRSRIRNVSYRGWPEFEDSNLLPRFYSDNVFDADVSDEDTLEVDDNYRVNDLRGEQSRIIDFLKNNGYAAVQRDSVRALVKEVPDLDHTYDVLYDIKPGRFYTFGDVHISLAGPEGSDDYDQEHEASEEPYTNPGFSIYMNKQSSAQTRFSLLTEQVRFKPGEPFDQSAYLQTINAYQNLGIFLTNRFGLSEDGSSPDFSGDEIPVFFELQTIPKHTIRAEFFGMRRYGFGTGLGVNYNNNNLRGRADNLSIGVNTSLEYVTSGTLSEIAPTDPETGARTRSGSTFFQSYEVRGEYTVPRLNFPLQPLQNRSWVQSSRTRYLLSYSQSDQLFFRINSDIRFNLRYEITHSDQVTSLFDLIEMDIIDTDPSEQFRQNLISEFGEQSIEFLRIEEDFRPQFSSIIRYTIRNRNVDLIKRDSGFSTELSAAIGGNVPYLLDRYIFDAGNVDQTLPSPLGISSNDLQYSRFLKFSADFRRYFELTPNSVFAVRTFSGYALPIFDSQSIPLSRRFFAGGSNDIRGWDPFRLGPGTISPENVALPGGEVKLAAFKELRQVVVSDFLNTDWHLAWHTDAGNIWYGPRTTLLGEDDRDLLDDGRFSFDNFYNQIAVGSGIGLRLDWEFLVARFDITYRVHDLQEGWFENSTPRFSFGIGHSF